MKVIKNILGIVILCLSLALAFTLGILLIGGVAHLAVNHSYWTIPALPVALCVLMAVWAMHVSIVEWTVSWVNGL